MRDLIHKNITSTNRKKRVISSYETREYQGVHTTIRRRFICKVIEIENTPKNRTSPQVYVCRNCNHNQQRESFLCRMKASLYAKSNGKLFLVLFGHSLRIDLRPATPTFLS